MQHVFRTLVLVFVLLTSLEISLSEADEILPGPNKVPTPSEVRDSQLFDSCLGYALDEFPKPTSPHRKENTALDLKDAVVPPNLVTRTKIVGDVPAQIRKYRGRWALRLANKSSLPYAAFVESLTPTEMTIALAMRVEEGNILNPMSGFRHKLLWDGSAFVGHNVNLWGSGEVTLAIGLSQFGDVMILITDDGREGHLEGCLFSEQP